MKLMLILTFVWSDDVLSIGVFSKIGRITSKTLRYYDEIGLLKPAFVDPETGYRFYAPEQLQQVLMINKLKSYCLSLDEIIQVTNENSQQARLSLLQHFNEKQGEIQGRITHYKQVLHQLLADKSNLERGHSLMDYLKDISVSLTTTSPMNLLFVRETINIKDYPALLQKLFEKVGNQNLTPTGAPLTFYHSEEYTPQHYDVEVAVPVANQTKETKILPAILCAQVLLKGEYSLLPSVYAKLQEWIIKEGYTLAGSPFEVYLTDPNQTPAQENLTQVYLPVTK